MLRKKQPQAAVDGLVSMVVVLSAAFCTVAMFSLQILCEIIIPSQHPDLLPAKAGFLVLMTCVTFVTLRVFSLARTHAMSF